MTELDPLEQMLKQARAELAPSFAEEARLRGSLGLDPALRPPATQPGSSAAPKIDGRELRAWRALRASGSAGILAGTVLAGVAFGAGLWLGRAEGDARPPPLSPTPAAIEPAIHPARQPPPTAPERSGAPQAGNDESAELAPTRAEPTARRETRPPRRAQRRAPATAPSGASEELALLQRVGRALRAQNPALALALIAELEQRFPETRLAEEREAARVIASCGLGEGGARLRAERFSRENGGSVYAERVREACAISEGSTRGEGSALVGDE